MCEVKNCRLKSTEALCVIKSEIFGEVRMEKKVEKGEKFIRFFNKIKSV